MAIFNSYVEVLCWSTRGYIYIYIHYSWFTYQKWCLSMVMLVYQRVSWSILFPCSRRLQVACWSLSCCGDFWNRQVLTGDGPLVTWLRHENSPIESEYQLIYLAVLVLGGQAGLLISDEDKGFGIIQVWMSSGARTFGSSWQQCRKTKRTCGANSAGGRSVPCSAMWSKGVSRALATTTSEHRSRSLELGFLLPMYEGCLCTFFARSHEVQPSKLGLLSTCLSKEHGSREKSDAQWKRVPRQKNEMNCWSWSDTILIWNNSEPSALSLLDSPRNMDLERKVKRRERECLGQRRTWTAMDYVHGYVIQNAVARESHL